MHSTGFVLKKNIASKMSRSKMMRMRCEFFFLKESYNDKGLNLNAIRLETIINRDNSTCDMCLKFESGWTDQIILVKLLSTSPNWSFANASEIQTLIKFNQYHSNQHNNLLNWQIIPYVYKPKFSNVNMNKRFFFTNYNLTTHVEGFFQKSEIISIEKIIVV